MTGTNRKIRLFPALDITSEKMRVVDAAIESIATDGIENLTFQTVATKMGKRPSHIKYYFPDKNKLMETAFRHLISSMQSYVIAAIATEEDPRKALEKYVVNSLQFLEENPRFWPLITLYYYHCSRNADFREMNRKFRQTAIVRIGSLVEEIGGIPKARTQAVAQQIFMLVHKSGMEFIYDQRPGMFTGLKRLTLSRLSILLRTEN